MVLDLPGSWGPPLPGQFVQLQAPIPGYFRLQRPFGVAGWHVAEGGAGRLDIVYAPVGAESRRMTELRRGDQLDWIGPLGVGYAVLKERRAVLVAGGRGIAPLLYLASELERNSHPCRLLYGYRSREERWAVGPSTPLHEASEDGSRGLRGTVLDLLDSLLLSSALDPARDALYICGPTPMLRAVAAWNNPHRFPLQVSLETIFGCGCGLCAGCAVPMRGGEGFDAYALACRQGPVFPAEKVDWNGFVE
jgi:dihydroorotate dehydrogenase electron transfer subunit